MSRFYGDIQGNRGQASRMGTEKSGFDAHVRGWDIGIRVYLRADGETDVLTVFLTGGSNGRGGDKFLGEWRQGPDGRKEVKP